MTTPKTHNDALDNILSRHRRPSLNQVKIEANRAWTTDTDFAAALLASGFTFAEPATEVGWDGKVAFLLSGDGGLASTLASEFYGGPVRDSIASLLGRAYSVRRYCAKLVQDAKQNSNHVGGVEKQSRHGDWVMTYTGRKFWPLDPKPEDVDIQDIAHALSMKCRFCGHVRQFHSVAMHSVLVSDYLDDKFALWGLLHDAAEAYLADLAAPIKPFMPGWQNVEKRIQQAICNRFDLGWPEPREVKEMDTRWAVTEADQLMAGGTTDWHSRYLDLPKINFKIPSVEPAKAEAVFLQRFQVIYC